MSILTALIFSPLRVSLNTNCLVRQQYFKNFSTTFIVCIKCGSPLRNTIPRNQLPSYFKKAREERAMRNKKLKFIGFLGGFAVIIGLANYFRSYLGFPKKEFIYKGLSLSEVIAHPGWTSYNGGVYDLSKFGSRHPGGEEFIVKATELGRLEPLWEEFPFHYDGLILAELEDMKVGYLNDEDTIVRKRVQCHEQKEIVRVDPASYELEVSLGGETIKKLKLDDLKRLPKYTVNREIKHKNNKKEPESNDTPKWAGASLGDLFKELGVNVEDYKLVRFECIDTNSSGKPYGHNILFRRVTSDEILLAYEMDGNELPLEHGFPVRVVMPEFRGSKNVKWLSKILLVKKEEMVS